MLNGTLHDIFKYGELDYVEHVFVKNHTEVENKQNVAFDQELHQCLMC